MYAANQNISTLSWSANPSPTLAQIVIELLHSSDFVEEVRGFLGRNVRPKYLANAPFSADADGTRIAVDDSHSRKEFPVDFSVKLADLARIFGDGFETLDVFTQECVANQITTCEQVWVSEDFLAEPTSVDVEFRVGTWK